MKHFSQETDPTAKTNWRLIKHLTPYLLESRYRVLLALVCLILAKGAIIFIPFLLKQLVDSLDGVQTEQLLPGLLIGLVLAYGAARFANVFFGELRDTIFGRVTERAMRPNRASGISSRACSGPRLPP